jgi:hypothetical protein
VRKVRVVLTDRLPIAEPDGRSIYRIDGRGEMR